MYKADRYFIAMGKKFTNIWQAYEELKHTNYDIEPYYENEGFKNLGKVDIDLDKDYVAESLKDIFSKYKKVNLLYSGGVDSHTILVSALKNNLNFNQVLTFGKSINNDPYLDGENNNVQIQNYMRDNNVNWKFYPNSLEWMEKIFLSDDWHLKDSGEFNMCPEVHLSHLDLIKKDELYIVGKDKPSLLHFKNRWYAFYTHTFGLDYCNHSNFMYFYHNTDYPKLMIQQHHKLRDWYIKNYGIPTVPLVVDLGWAGRQQNVGWYKFNEIIGRTHALNSQSEIKKTKQCIPLNYKHLRMFVELDSVGRRDLVDIFLEKCHSVYKNYKQIEWSWPAFLPEGKTPWLYDIDTGEYLTGEKMGLMLK